jgi:hypothetical protein
MVLVTCMPAEPARPPLRIKFVKGRSRPVPEDPSLCEPHTPSPENYMGWWAWADKMAETHVNRQCRGCGLWAIWEPKP